MPSPRNIRWRLPPCMRAASGTNPGMHVSTCTAKSHSKGHPKPPKSKAAFPRTVRPNSAGIQCTWSRGVLRIGESIWIHKPKNHGLRRQQGADKHCACGQVRTGTLSQGNVDTPLEATYTLHKNVREHRPKDKELAQGGSKAKTNGRPPCSAACTRLQCKSWLEGHPLVSTTHLHELLAYGHTWPWRQGLAVMNSASDRSSFIHCCPAKVLPLLLVDWHLPSGHKAHW